MIDNKKVNLLIPKAIKAIENQFGNNAKVPNEYRNYLASFGTVVRMSGIETAVAIYSKGSNGIEDKSKVILMIYDVLYLKEGEKNKIDNVRCHMLKLIEKDESKYKIKDSILEAAIALKLALNFFELEVSDRDKV